MTSTFLRDAQMPHANYIPNIFSFFILIGADFVIVRLCLFFTICTDATMIAAAAVAIATQGILINRIDYIMQIDQE